MTVRGWAGAGLLLIAGAAGISAAGTRFVALSSTRGELPKPGDSTQQTAALAVKVDPKAGTDFVLGFRKVAPALVWYRRSGDGWTRYVIEKEFLAIEAGGAAYDIDGDGDNDVVFGGDASSNCLWWWENPSPNFDPSVSWKRHVIKCGGANQHHDQIFADLKRTGRPQLIFWNQRAKTLFLADIPKDPRNSGPWPLEVVFSGSAGEGVESAAAYAEGLDAYDVDGDGKLDLLAGNRWFKYLGQGKFQATRIAEVGGRIKAAKFKAGKHPQVVIAPGDGSGPLRLYECNGDPSKTESWRVRNLLDRDMVHGHTLEIGDLNGDGKLDIFTAEMAKWTNTPKPADHHNATAWILYGDGRGSFEATVLRTGDGWHDAKLGDFDGDGKLDILNKPYTWETPRVDLWLNKGSTTRKQAGFRRHLGMELWTYRHQLAKDLPGTLATIRQLGITDVETASFYQHSAAEFRRLLDEAGLTCTSYIAGHDQLKSDLDRVMTDASALGAAFVLTAGIPHKGELTEADVRRAAADFNDWGEKLKARGIRFGYHPHGFEFVKTQRGNLFDLLLELTRPEHVAYEMDVFWFTHGGADPVKYLQRHGSRFPLMHLKDMAKGTATGLATGRAPDEASVSLGAGVLNMPAILRAAKRAGVKYYYIEDESPAAPSQVPVTLDYLKRMKF
jgi:sugar phosphate isomerase/epimerase